MDWRILLEPDVRRFIEANTEADVAALALKKPPSPDWPYPLILDQIKTRQKARRKTPEFVDIEGFLFPPHAVYEQASSSACAAYKASQVSGGRAVDLTGGCGIDAFFLARRFKEIIIAEHDPHAAALLAHNAQVLKRHGFITCAVTVHAQDAGEVLVGLDQADLVYIDPQRRDKNRKGVFDFSSCSPDIIDLLPQILSKTDYVLMKASPVLDIHLALEQLGTISEVHVVGWDKDCKEILYFIDKNKKIVTDDITIKAVEINDDGTVFREFSYRNEDEKNTLVEYALPKKFLYEPTPAFMKSGGFRSMARTYGLAKLHPHAHLYTSDVSVPDFPGKGYLIEAVISLNAKEFKITHAEISVRHYPDKAESLRKKLKLKEGGDHRIFATTLMDNTPKLILCRKNI